MKEYERKFKVKSNSWLTFVYRNERIEQYYLCNDDVKCIRIRSTIKDTLDFGLVSSYTLTIKSATPGFARTEIELSIPKAEFEMLRPLANCGTISKNRFHLIDCPFTIDVFDDGKVIAEVEFKPQDAQKTWTYEWLGEEVTDDKSYYNADMAKASK
jgi:adenylate cyclase